MAEADIYTIGDQLTVTRGRPSGFDYMRLWLSLSIVVLHSCVTGYGILADTALMQGWARPLIRAILPMFFALSGFLVAGSLERTRTLGMFLGLRAIRIYPALMVEVVLSAFILGPLVTTLPAAAYFSHPTFLHYLLNVTGDVHFSLPGVFATNPVPDIVNGQLWTIPFELYCYCTIAAAALLGLRKRRAIGPLVVAAVIVAYLFVTLYRHHWTVVPVPGAINGALLIAAFLAGASIYAYRDVLPFNNLWGLTSIVLALALLGGVPYGDFFAPVPAAYATVYLGMKNPSRKALRGADYSYGIYLYGFAVQQTVVYLLPFAKPWYINSLISVPAVTLVAAASWHFVERPANRLRPWLKRLEDRYLAQSRGGAPAADPLR